MTTAEKDQGPQGGRKIPGGVREQGGSRACLPCACNHPSRGLHARAHAEYLLGCLVPQRALINESSDPTIVTCIPLRRALFCQVWHGGDGQSCTDLRNQPCQLLRFALRKPGERQGHSHWVTWWQRWARARLCDGQPCLSAHSVPWAPEVGEGHWWKPQSSLVHSHPIPSTKTQCGRLPGQMVS